MLPFVVAELPVIHLSAFVRRLGWLHGRDWRHNPLRTLLTLSGIALGVAAWLSIQLVTTASVDQFEQGVEQVAGKATLEILPTTGEFLQETQVLPPLKVLWSLHTDWRPVLDGVVIWPTAPNEVIRLLGVDLAGSADERDTDWAPGGQPADELAVFQAGQVYVGQALAKQYGLTLGQTFDILVNDRRERLTVSGILGNKGLGGSGSGHLIVMDIGPAQALLNRPGQLSRVELLATKAQQPDVMRVLGPRLPRDVRLQPPARRGERMQQMLAAYHINLTALSLIALMVGVYLIYNTLSMTVLRRRSEIGILRSLGMSRAQVLAHYLTEAALYGALGSAGGVALGWGLAHGLSGLVSQTMQVVYSGQPIGPLAYPPWLLATGGAVGLLISLAGGLIPALEAASVAPAQATRGNSGQSAWLRWINPLAWLGLGLLGLGVLAGFQPPIHGLPIWGYVSSTLGIVGLTFGSPWILWHTLPWLSNMTKRFTGKANSAAVQIGLRQLRGGLGRTAIAVSALAVSVGMVVSLTIMIASFRQTVQTWVNQTLRADLFIQPLGATFSRGGGQLSEDTVRLIATTPGIAAIDDFLETSIDLDGTPAKLGVGNFRTFRQYGSVRFVDGEPFDRALDRLSRNPRGALVSEPLAVRLGLKRGQSLSLSTPQGPVAVTVENIYYDYASEQGYVLIDRALFRQLYPPGTGSNSVAVYLPPGGSPEKVRQAILDRLPPASRLTMRTNGELRAEVLRIFDQTFAITYALQAIALLVAVLSVANTLLALTWEQRRQLAVLRATGAAAGQIRQLVLGQAVTLGGYGIGLGGLLGAGLSALLIFVVNRQAFGWTLGLTVPWGTLIECGVALLLASWAAGWWPARQAARMGIAGALAETSGR